MSSLSITLFSGSWCPGCRAIKPILSQLSKQYDIPIQEIDVDEQKAFAQQYQVTSIPVVLFMKDGKMVERLIGAQTKSTYVKKIETHL